MSAITFNTKIHNGVIVLPREYSQFKTAKVQVSIQVLPETSNFQDAPPGTKSKPLSDSYIDEHWKELLVEGLQGIDPDYFESEAYTLERGADLAEKYK